MASYLVPASSLSRVAPSPTTTSAEERKTEKEHGYRETVETNNKSLSSTSHTDSPPLPAATTPALGFDPRITTTAEKSPAEEADGPTPPTNSCSKEEPPEVHSSLSTSGGAEDIIHREDSVHTSEITQGKRPENNLSKEHAVKFEASARDEKPAEMFGARQRMGRSARDLLGLDVGVPDHMAIIDWASAIDQCSGDASFLDELLVDLWTESTAHIRQLQEFVPNGDMIDSKNEAHAIKGAAANLMCHRLRTAALYIETGGLVGTRVPQGGKDWKTVKRSMEVGLQHLELELARFENMLKQKRLI